MRKRQCRTFVADFETTVYDNQDYTEVWASGCAELFTDDVLLFHSLDEQLNYFFNLKSNIICYFHNLKFDGNFILSHLLNVLNFKQATNGETDLNKIRFLENKDMPNKSFKYSISDRGGMWYSLIIKIHGKLIEFRDSLKLLPFKLAEIGENFKTKHRKLEMEYKGFRYAGCKITPEEEEYIKNDVYVLKEAMETMFLEGHNKLTIGSCCLAEYKKLIGEDDYNMFFPDLTQVSLDKTIYGYDNADKYIRKSYKGGWCYLVERKENKLFTNGTTADVNSLYPSVMHSMSGNRYPVGKPCFWKGNFIPDKAIGYNKYYFVRIKTRFSLKEDYLPFIQIKDNMIYKSTECLKTSDYYDKKLGKYVRYYKRGDEILDTRVTLTLTMTDYELFLKHYNVSEFEILDGCWFFSEIGLFDDYINKYAKIKMESKGAKRTLAKLFLNNLYGKLASNTDSSFKLAFLKEDKSVGFYTIPASDKEAGHIATGSAITSYARHFTITSAQSNYYGVDKRGFIYADTDSIHCDLLPEEIKNVEVDDVKFCHWKLETCWDKGLFVRQKTYIEHVTHENLQEIDKPYYNVKCAGMSEKSKKLFLMSMGEMEEEKERMIKEHKLEPYEEEFVNTKRTLSEFKIGLKVSGKLIPKRIKGGVILVDTLYEMR